ncbi:MAG: nicotinic acid mononucleotide adenyltransferase [Winogradskyella sp.]|uniref:toxin-antitoxin system YwqK family antitoxin n=1 Tax=Winogradskyella sp. TaxID=1883156 RepID=UPI001858150A|nr:nicotinic acid mononucleotide adenyltransferase [Winogradskyella sp.]MBT8244285.1 nicotinic acid mononucleotide adenyltransferase [Winogradskyella sp.]NNK23697.1 nicotinic acid mononucleotide adenyltransferase [Winogradskyella sp.]
MNKKILVLFAFFIGMVSFAQQERELKVNEDTNLIDVIYYHDNGVISQTGSYTLDGKLHGKWLSFDSNGKKNVAANYDNGQKVGKWFYWSNKTLKEVDYTKNIIVSISDWQKDTKTSVAIRNK